VEFTLAGLGWIGIGFGGSMFKSDMIVGYIAANGSAVVTPFPSTIISYHITSHHITSPLA
jgi:hypothetical protein